MLVNPKGAVTIGGSAGSLEALQAILPRLPLNYGLAVIVVLHQHRHGGQRLGMVLARDSKLPVVPIENGDAISPGRIYVCPANYHVLVEEDHTLVLSTDPPMNFARPSIDVLFESAARVYRERLVGVLLSGASADGARGLASVRAHGGVVVCQDPATAREPTMPRAGCEATGVSYVGSPEVIGTRLAELQP